MGRWRRPARAAAILYVLLTAVAPVAALLIVSFQRFWSATFVPGQFSLVNYATVLAGNSKTMRALTTSFGLGFVGATVTMLAVGFLTLHAAHGGGARLRGWIDTITGLPATIPHSVIGVSFLLAFALPPWSLYGTLQILLLAYIAMQLPYAARTAAVAASDIGLELGESSRVSGATQFRTFRRILLPLALPGLVAGWAIVFVHNVGELTASAILSGTENQVIAKVLMDMWNEGSFPQVAAIAIVITILNTIFVAVALLVTRRVSSISTY